MKGTVSQIEPLRAAREILTIPQAIRRSAAQFGSRVALRTWRGDRYFEITYRQLSGLADRLGRALREVGLEPGDRIAILSENRPEWVAAYLGSLAAALVVVPLDVRLREGEIHTILRRAQVRALFASRGYEEIAVEAQAGLEDLEVVVFLDEDVEGAGEEVYTLTSLAGGWSDVSRDVAVPSVDRGFEPQGGLPARDDMAAILFTSGTTGHVKGIMLSHRNIMANVESLYCAILINDNSRLLSVLPLHHVLEATCGMLTPLSVGASITYARSLKSGDILADLLGTKATMMIGVPLLFENLLRGIDRGLARRPPLTRTVVRSLTLVTRGAKRVGVRQAGRVLLRGVREKAGLGSVRFLVSGGAPLRAEIVDRFALLGMSLLQGYGLSESAPVLTVNPEGRNRPGTVGQALPGVEVRLHNQDDEGIGEIIARGENVMAGYYMDEDLTRQTIREGWLYTGDLGGIDEKGYLFVVGRVKDVIVTSAGKNVYPEEVEAELVLSPYIAEALVVGRTDPDTGREDVQAIIVVDEEVLSKMERSRGAVLTDDQLHELLRSEVKKCCERLAPYKRVKRLEIRREGFPMTTTRKIKRYLFKDRAIPV